MKSQHSLCIKICLFLIIILFGQPADSIAQIVGVNEDRASRTQEEAQEIRRDRQIERDREIQSRQIERLKKIDDRFKEQYYWRIIPQIDELSLAVYSRYLGLPPRVREIETKFNALIYGTIADAGISLRPEAGTPLPEGVVDFDIEEKFRNAQACLDNFYYTTPERGILNQRQGECWLYDIPASGVASTSAGLMRLRPPGIQLFGSGWDSFLDRVAQIPGALWIGRINITPPTRLIPAFIPPYIPNGLVLSTDRDWENLRILPYYGEQSLQIMTGFASQCLTDVPARYLPNYYIRQTGNPDDLTYDEIMSLPMNIVLSTPCDGFRRAGDALRDLLGELLSNLLNRPIQLANLQPFPEYEYLYTQLDAVFNPPRGLFPNQPYVYNFPPANCAPLNCTFSEPEIFRMAVNLQVNAFRQYVREMRHSTARIRLAYSALQHDIQQALLYHQAINR